MASASTLISRGTTVGCVRVEGELVAGTEEDAGCQWGRQVAAIRMAKTRKAADCRIACRRLLISEPFFLRPLRQPDLASL